MTRGQEVRLSEYWRASPRLRITGSMDQKLRDARLFQERRSVRPPILVDDLDGPVHRAFGMLPNMTYVDSAV